MHTAGIHIGSHATFHSCWGKQQTILTFENGSGVSNIILVNDGDRVLVNGCYIALTNDILSPYSASQICWILIYSENKGNILHDMV